MKNYEKMFASSKDAAITLYNYIVASGGGTCKVCPYYDERFGESCGFDFSSFDVLSEGMKKLDNHCISKFAEFMSREAQDDADDERGYDEDMAMFQYE